MLKRIAVAMIFNGYHNISKKNYSLFIIVEKSTEKACILRIFGVPHEDLSDFSFEDIFNMSEFFLTYNNSTHRQRPHFLSQFLR